MSWSKIEEHLFEKYCVEGEDKELCKLMEEHDKEIRDKAINKFCDFLHEKAKENNGLRLSSETRSWTHASIYYYRDEFREKRKTR